MKHQRITAKQAKAQILAGSFYIILGVFWIWNGIAEKDIYFTLFGSVFTLISVGMIGYTVWQRKHFPLEDPVLDAQIEDNIKTSGKGFAIVMGTILIGFILAIGLALLLKH